MPYFNILIPIISISSNILIQILSCRYVIKNELLKSIFSGFICGLAIFSLCEYFTYTGLSNEWTAFVVMNLIMYGCFSAIYFTVINMGETSRRIRLLRELYDSSQGLIKEQILAKYNAAEVIDRRMRRLLTNRQIIVREERYYVGRPAMLFISKTVILLKILITGKTSEFEK
jgi:hypothetical protein